MSHCGDSLRRKIVSSPARMFCPRHLPLLATFVQVCRAGSFTKAAKSLSTSKSVVSAHLRSLEEILDARLLERTTRRVVLTQIGQEVLAAADRMLSAANDVASIAESKRAEPTGVLRVAAPVYLGTQFVAPAVARLCSRYRQLRAELVLSDEKIDPIANHIDATVSVNVPKDSTLVSVQLGSDVEIIVAAPELAGQWQTAAQPKDLLGAPWIAHSSILAGAQDQFRNQRGTLQRLAQRAPSILANTCEAVRALVAGSAGFAVVPSQMVADDIRAGRLVHMLPDWKGRTVRIHACLPSRNHPPARTLTFLEELRTSFGVREPRRDNRKTAAARVQL
jgi:DNA-binding transcriptional LysR family regulator